MSAPALERRRSTVLGDAGIKLTYAPQEAPLKIKVPAAAPAPAATTKPPVKKATTVPVGFSFAEGGPRRKPVSMSELPATPKLGRASALGPSPGSDPKGRASSAASSAASEPKVVRSALKSGPSPGKHLTFKANRVLANVRRANSNNVTRNARKSIDVNIGSGRANVAFMRATFGTRWTNAELGFNANPGLKVRFLTALNSEKRRYETEKTRLLNKFMTLHSGVVPGSEIESYYKTELNKLNAQLKARTISSTNHIFGKLNLDTNKLAWAISGVNSSIYDRQKAALDLAYAGRIQAVKDEFFPLIFSV